MAECRRVRRQRKHSARAVLVGVLLEHPEATTLPRERTEYARLRVDVLGKVYDIDAYGLVVKKCSVLPADTLVQAVCDLAIELPTNPIPNGRPKMRLELRQIRICEPPEEITHDA